MDIETRKYLQALAKELGLDPNNKRVLQRLWLHLNIVAA